MDAVTPLKMQAVEQAIYNAIVEDRDMAAGRLYLEYTLGKSKGAEDGRDDDSGPLVIEPPLPLPEQKTA